MLLERDARTNTDFAVHGAVLRLCVHAPGTEAGAAQLRVALIADLLARAAELRGTQVLTARTLADLTGVRAAALDAAETALAIRPAIARTDGHDVASCLGGPAHVHVVGQWVTDDHSYPGALILVGPVRDERQQWARTPLLGEHGPRPRLPERIDDPLALRLATLSFRHQQPLELSADLVGEAQTTLRRWRSRVAEWAEAPFEAHANRTRHRGPRRTGQRPRHTFHHRDAQ